MSPAERLSGREPFHRNGVSFGPLLADFWRWTDSDLLSNALRGRLAEYLVALDLGTANETRSEWIAYDLETPDGVKVEVKSAAYVQTWHQDRPSIISFSIAPTLGWDPDTSEFGSERRRQSEVYVFALLVEQDQSRIDPLDVAQWEFFVLPTKILNERLGNQKTIRLSRLLELTPEKVEHGEILPTIRRIL